MRSKILTLIVTLFAVCGMASITKADVPGQINYQGVLTDSAGKRLTGTYGMTFRIYRDSTGGAPIWEETQSVACSCGIFNVILGQVKPFEPADSALQYEYRWLGIMVGTDPEMTPRRKLTSVPYAYHAGYVGWEYVCPPGNNSVEIPFPHYCPFQIMISELGGTSDQSAWMSGGENDRQLSFVGIDGSGNVVHGTVSLYSTQTILTVRSGLVLRPKGDGTFALVLDSSGYGGESKAVFLAPHHTGEGPYK